MKRIYIIHGYGGYPEKNWFPWLRKELEALGHSVVVPQMPNPDHPSVEEWVGKLKEVAPAPDETTLFIGHSLGSITILRYLETLPPSSKVGGAILVAGFLSTIDVRETDAFVESPLDTEKIQNIAERLVAIQSTNDPHVPRPLALEIQDRLHAELITIENGGHLNEKSGYKEFPLLLETIQKIIN